MRKSAMLGLVIVILAAIATGVVTAFAQSTSQPTSNNLPDPRPGYTYTVVFRQTDGFIVAAVACLPSHGVTCTQTPQPGQSVMDITDQPLVVHQLFADWYYGKGGNWHVDLSTHHLASTTPASASIAPSLGLSVVGAILSASASLGVGTSGTLIWRRTLRHA